jgi:hypothetical protein
VFNIKFVTERVNVFEEISAGYLLLSLLPFLCKVMPEPE